MTLIFAVLFITVVAFTSSSASTEKTGNAKKCTKEEQCRFWKMCAEATKARLLGNDRCFVLGEGQKSYKDARSACTQLDGFEGRLAYSVNKSMVPELIRSAIIKNDSKTKYYLEKTEEASQMRPADMISEPDPNDPPYTLVFSEGIYTTRRSDASYPLNYICEYTPTCEDGEENPDTTERPETTSPTNEPPPTTSTPCDVEQLCNWIGGQRAALIDGSCVVRSATKMSYEKAARGGCKEICEGGGHLAHPKDKAAFKWLQENMLIQANEESAALYIGIEWKDDRGYYTYYDRDGERKIDGSVEEALTNGRQKRETWETKDGSAAVIWYGGWYYHPDVEQERHYICEYNANFIG